MTHGHPPATRFGRYRLDHLLGEGGTGRVYAAELQGPAGFRKRVAVKILRPELSLGNADARAGLAREGRLGGLLSHRNVVETYELGEVDGQLFVAMALVRGPSLAQLIARSGALSGLAVLQAAVQICAGLVHIHGITLAGGRRGIVHRDLKPANALVDESGTVRIADLGIADLQEALGASSDRRGTPLYMAPEQILGDALDARSDLFALGVMVAEMATGANPFQGPTDADVVHKVLASDVLVLELGVVAAVDATMPGLGALVESLLRRDPARRPTDASMVLDQLRGLLPAATGPALSDYVHASGGEPWIPETRDAFPTETSWGDTLVLEHLPPTNLRTEVDTFVGREEDLALLDTLLAEGRLVTLKGAGGTGKTRLALRYGVTRLERWSGGVWLCDLTEARDLRGVLFAVATALSVPFGEGTDVTLARQLAHAITSRGRVLVLLDNFEQVTDQAADTVGRWIEAAPEARFLVTSRERLQLRAERVVELAPLTRDDAVHLLTLRAVGPGWEGADEALLTRIVERVDQLPLAIELAAARSAVLSPAQLLARLEDGLGMLRLRERQAPERQRTLRGTIDWSWGLLQPWEQGALAQLSVFRGGFTLDAAEQVLDLGPWPEAPWAIDVVGSLFDKSLLVTREVGRAPRFSMYEAIREYASEHLADPAHAELRHAEQFARLVGELHPRLRTAADAATVRRLLVEIDNLTAGCARASAAGRAEIASWCALGAAAVFGRRGPVTSGLLVVEQALATRPPPSPPDELRLLHEGWTLASHSGQVERAEVLARRALGLAESLGDPTDRARCLGALASVFQVTNRAREALELTGAALAVAPPDALRAIGWVTTLRAKLLVDLGRPAEAEAHLLRSIELARTLGDLASVGSRLCSLALVYTHQTRQQEAYASLREAIDLLEATESHNEAGRAHGNLAILLRQLGRTSEARHHYETALGIYRRIGNVLDEAIASANLGVLHYLSGDHQEAETWYRASMRLNERLRNQTIEAYNLGNLANLLRVEGRLDEAAEHFERAGSLYAVLGNRHYAAMLRGDLGVVEYERGRYQVARSTLEEAIATLEEVGDRRIAIGLTRALAETLLELDDDRAARQALDRVLQALELGQASPSGGPSSGRIGDSEIAHQTWITRARFAVRAGALEEALSHARAGQALAAANASRPAEAKALGLIAEVHLARAEHEEALRVIAGALSLTPEVDRPRRGLLLGHRGVALAHLGRPEEARAAFDEALRRIHPRDVWRAASVRLLRAELADRVGLDPGPDLQAVAGREELGDHPLRARALAELAKQAGETIP